MHFVLYVTPSKVESIYMTHLPLVLSPRGLEEMAEVGLGNRTPPYSAHLRPIRPSELLLPQADFLGRLPQRTRLNQACSDHQLSRLQPTTPPLVAGPPQLPLRLHRSPAPQEPPTPQEHLTLLKCNRFFMCNFNLLSLYYLGLFRQLVRK